MLVLTVVKDFVRLFEPLTFTFCVAIITVEPLLSGHPWGMARWPFNRGGRLIEVSPIWTRIWSNFLVFTYKSLFIMYKSKMSTSMKNSLKRKKSTQQNKKNLSNFDKDQAFNTRNLVHTRRLVWRSIIEFPIEIGMERVTFAKFSIQ